MERRVLLAIFLSFIVIYLWQAVFFKPAVKPPVNPASATAAKTPATSATAAGQPASAPIENVEKAPDAASTAPVATAAPVVASTEERDIRVETADVIALFTNRGGRLKSWKLKHYLDAGEPLELVATRLPSSQPLPFSLRVAEPATSSTLNSALYTVKGAPDSGSAIGNTVRLEFEYADASGLHAVKRFTLEPTSYVIGFDASVAVGDRALTPTLLWGPGLGDTEQASRSATPPGGLLSAQRKEQRLAVAAIAKQALYSGDYEFAGVDDHYFASLVLKSGPVKISYEPFTVPLPEGATGPAHTLVGYSVEPPAANHPFKVYFGPKDFDQLKKVDADLPRAIHFGVFTVIVVPLLNSLKWINSFIGNYGWSILALTAIINLIILPLRHKSVVSMRKMQEIQPEAEAIKSRYAKLKATDPAKQKMNQELMELYRERGVNPASGCVPMLLPIPILFAFYSLLSTAIELRGAPFMLWIQDLSRPDPFYVTPVLMGASQLWQQWIAPAAGVDPIQRRMMMIMPVVFVFLFISYPSGVALYWFASNVWAIGQQYATNYFIGPPNVRTVRPPAERKLKQVGAGKTDAAAREK